MALRYSQRQAHAREIRLRVPDALYDHLADQAEAHKRSLNAEILHLLMDPKRRVYQEHRRQFGKEVQEVLEDWFGPDWRGTTIAAGARAHDALPDGDIDAEIEWLHPGGRWQT